MPATTGVPTATRARRRSGLALNYVAPPVSDAKVWLPILDGLRTTLYSRREAHRPIALRKDKLDHYADSRVLVKQPAGSAGALGLPLYTL